MYSEAVAQYSLNRVDRGRLSSCLVDWSVGSTRVVGGAAGGSVTDALEVNDFPELSDVLSLPAATGPCSFTGVGVSLLGPGDRGQRTLLGLDLSVHARKILDQIVG